MSCAKLSRSRWLVLSIGAFVAVAFGCSASGQTSPRIKLGHVQINGVPEDWSHHHLIFADPGTEEAAIKAGRHEQWLKAVNDPRYVMQQLRRKSTVRGPLADDAVYVQYLKAELARAHRPVPPDPSKGKKEPPTSNSALKTDWAVPLTTSSIMPNTFPVKYSFNPLDPPNCLTDFVAFPTGATGSATAATIVAFNELYPGAGGCGGPDDSNPVPQVYWAYNTTIPGTAPGSVTTSPELSLDGSMIEFVQSGGGSVNLIVLKTLPVPIAGGSPSVTAPVSITSASAGMDCTAPCMTVTPLTAARPNSDTFSSPFYDYTDDILYVGDDFGDLYQIAPVFNSTASNPPVATSVGTTAIINGQRTRLYNLLDSPVYDEIGGCVFVGSSAGLLFSFNSGVPGGTICTSPIFSENAASSGTTTRDGGGMLDGVVLDPFAGEIYGFVASGDNVPQCGVPGQIAFNCVVQYPTYFTDQAAPSGAVPIGFSTYGDYIFSGALDNVYYSSADAGHPSGNLWVVGNVNNYLPAILYQVPIASNVMETPIVAAQPGSQGTNPPFTPGFATTVTENCNFNGDPCVVSGGQTTSGIDTIYFSINQGSPSGCNTSSADYATGEGCVLAYNVSIPSAPTLTGSAAYAFSGPGPVAGLGGDVTGCWGTTPIITDNDFPAASDGGSNVYYMTFEGNSPPGGTSACGTPTAATSQAIQILLNTVQ